MAAGHKHSEFLSRVWAYCVSAILASIIYLVWMTVWMGANSARDPEIGHVGWGSVLAVMCLYWLVGGFALALVLMAAPWVVAVWFQIGTLWDSRIFFPAVGAFLLFTVGCTASSISWKPPSIDDQTFFQGALIAAERQGLCLAVCGVAFGASYALYERRIERRF